MNASQELAGRFREVILSGTWVAQTNYKDQLTGLDWKTATATTGSLNTISVLTQHIHYYIHGVLHVFKGGDLEIRDRFSFDFPPVQSQQEWEQVLLRFWSDADAFALAVEQMTDEKLNEVFVKESYGTVRRNIDGLIEHAYYHLGQIVLIRKILDRANQST